MRSNPRKIGNTATTISQVEKGNSSLFERYMWSGAPSASVKEKKKDARRILDRPPVCPALCAFMTASVIVLFAERSGDLAEVTRRHPIDLPRRV